MLKEYHRVPGSPTALKNLAREAAQFGADPAVWTEILTSYHIQAWQTETFSLSDEATHQVHHLARRIAEGDYAGRESDISDMGDARRVFRKIVEREYYRCAPAYSALTAAGIDYDTFEAFINEKINNRLVGLNGSGLIWINNGLGPEPKECSLAQEWPNIKSDILAWKESLEEPVPPETERINRKDAPHEKAPRLAAALMEFAGLNVIDGASLDHFDPGGERFLAVVNEIMFPSRPENP